MRTKIAVFEAVVLGLFVSTVLAEEQEPIDLRLKWQPGQTLRYRLALDATTYVEGQSMRLALQTQVDVRVVATAKASDAGAWGDRTDPDGDDLSKAMSSGEEVMTLELIQQPVVTTISLQGQRLVMTVSGDDVTASVNGRMMSQSELAQFRNDVAPLQKALKAPVQLTMTRTGRVVRVSGLEGLDPETKKQLAMSYFDSFQLPETPKRVGEQFLNTRQLGSLLPSQPNASSASVSGTLDIVSTLKMVTKDTQGRRIAEIHTPMKHRFERVPLDEEGMMGSMDFDMTCTTSFEMDRGTITAENIRGVVVMHPEKRAGSPDSIKTNIGASFVLVEMTGSQEVARGM